MDFLPKQRLYSKKGSQAMLSTGRDFLSTNRRRIA